MVPVNSPLPLARCFKLAIASLLLFGASGCDEDELPASAPKGASPPGAEKAKAPADGAMLARPPAGYTDGSGINEGYPDLAPMPLAPDLEWSEAGARNVLLAFARAIELREYDQAWAMLNNIAQQSFSKRDFNALFAGLSDISVAVPGGEMEGAAGSSYYSSHAMITALGADGRPVRLEGLLVLRRVNDVPGASASQLHWLVDQVDLMRVI